MIKEALDALVALGQRSQNLPLLETVAGTYEGVEQTYIHKVDVGANGRTLGNALTPFRPAKLEVTTLTGFVDAINASVAGPVDKLKESRVIHVESYLTVSVASLTCDKFGVRDKLLTATYTPTGAFTFDSFYSDPQKFIIALQVGFYMTDELLYLIRVASNLTTKSEVNTKDDGFSQTVTIKQGEVKTAEATIKPRIKLIPRRTFDEAAPVESEFLVRLNESSAGTPTIALFSVDGTKWKADCMVAIKDYLTKHVKHVPILA